MHWPDPAQRPRIAEIRDNLIARIAEAEREGWLGEAEGLKISLAGANDKLAQIDRRTRHHTTVEIGLPTISRPADQPPATRQPKPPETSCVQPSTPSAEQAEHPEHDGQTPTR
jgi:hypothetical protein